MKANSQIEGFRVSPEQHRVWQLQQQQPGQPFRVQLAAVVSGPLDIPALRQAWTRLLSRHEILRTTFHCLPGMAVPVQVIVPPEDAAQSFFEHSSGDRRELDAVFDELLAAPFSFEKGPLAALHVQPASAGECVVILSTPALCGDSVGLRILLHELLESESAADSTTSPMQYADYAEWHASIVENAAPGDVTPWTDCNFEAARSWRLPFERPAKTEVIALQTATCQLASRHMAALSSLASGARTEIADVLMAAWSAAVMRFAGRNLPCVAEVIDGRQMPELKRAVGLFRQHVPMALQFAETTPFTELVAMTRSLRRRVVSALARFAWDSGGAQGGGAVPFAPVAFEFVEAETPAALGATIVREHACIDRFKLKLLAHARPSGIDLELSFDGASISSNDADRLLSALGPLIESAALNPEAAVAELRLCTESDARLVTCAFNKPTVEAGQPSTVLDLIDAAARQKPEREAVVCEGKSLSYGELTRKASQVAALLKGEGIRAGDCVALCFERSIDMVIAILGVMKANGAYVPLDPAYPADRLAFMLKDCNAQTMLTHARVKSLPAFPGRTIDLNLAWDAGAAESAPPSPDDLAYVIYTSGSTGRPKGVAITHSNLAHSTSARLAYYRDPVGAFLLLSSYSFDSSVAGIFWTLCTGGTLVIPPEGTQQEPVELARLIQQHSISHVLCLASLYHHILDQSPGGRLASLKTAIVAGESCSADLVARHFERLPGASLFNEYGPTEGTVWSTVCNCAAERERAPVAIGRPIPNCRVYVLDANRQPVPVWVKGEVYIGGPGVARGYLNRRDLTSERFVPDSFSCARDARLYRTGDVARWRADGQLEFLGRIDQQVKIRGYRIELEEVEATFAGHPAIRECAVIAQDDGHGSKRLIGYFAPAKGKDPSHEALTEFLRQRLPEWMVPGEFVRLETLPQTPNGKVDRRALPDAAKDRLANDYVAPRTETEEIVSRIWSELLKVDRIGVDENFFKVGGHSLLAIQVLSRLREALQVEVPLREFFRAPTIAQLAAAAADARNSSRSNQSLPIVGDETDAILAQLDDLSDEKVDALLTAVLDDRKPQL